MNSDQYNFASDNCAGVHPLVMKAIEHVNKGYVHSYGDDVYTKHAEELIRQQFGENAAVYFVYNGTGANVTGISRLIRSYQTVYCAETAHIHVDECGSLEHYAGCKLMALPSRDGKVSIDAVKEKLVGIGDEHRSQPGMISITQPTEYGVLYSVDEIRTLSDFAHKNGMLIHMDGARIANASASMNLSLKALTADCGIDLLSFGATKNGILCGEAVIIFRADLAESFQYIRKQGMQLHSKMRFISAQFIAMMSDGLWIDNARHANAMAQKLHKGLLELPGITFTQEVSCNAIFAIFPEKIIEPLQQKYHFYTWNETINEVRLMTSFQTSELEIDEFIKDVKSYILHQRDGESANG
jgi:threonine aldolase